MARRYNRRFLRRRGGFIPGAGPRSAKRVSRNRLSSRTSDFYARPVSRTRLSVPSLYRARSTGRRLSTSTQTKPMRSLKPAQRTSVQTRKADTQKKVRVIMDMRRRLRAPLRNRRGNTSKREYTYTPAEGNSTSYFTRKAMRIRGMRKRMMRTAPIQHPDNVFEGGEPRTQGTEVGRTALEIARSLLTSRENINPQEHNTHQNII